MSRRQESDFASSVSHIAVQQIGDFASATTKAPLFDGYSTTDLGIWDLRKRRSAYSGSAVRVNRAADNVQLDIGFLADGTFDMAAYSAFGTGSEKVVKIYDQSSNAADYVQADLAKCAIIRTSTYNSKPCWYGKSAMYDIAAFNNWSGDSRMKMIIAMRLQSHTALGAYTNLWNSTNQHNVTHYWGGAGITYFSLNNTSDEFPMQNLGGSILRYQFDGTAADALRRRYFVNTRELAANVKVSAPTTLNSSVGVTLNGPTGGIDAEFYGTYYVGQNISTTATEAALAAELFTGIPEASRLVAVGDSLTAMAGKWPDLLVTLMGSTYGSWIADNTAAVGGYTTAQALAKTELDVDAAYFKIDQFQRNSIVIAWAGTNDISTPGSVATALANALLICQRAKARGARNVFYLNIINRLDINVAADQASFNGSLVATLAGVATVIDVQGITELADPNNGTYFMGDKIHLTADGQAKIADKVLADITSILV